MALQTGAFYSGSICMANISQCSSRQAAFPSFTFPARHLSPEHSAAPHHPLHLAASGAVLLTAVAIASVVFGRTIFVYICCLALTRCSMCVVFGTFSTKHFTLFIFATIALRFQVTFEVFVLSVGAQFHQCCQCCQCCLLPVLPASLPAAAVCTYFACLPLALS